MNNETSAAPQSKAHRDQLQHKPSAAWLVPVALGLCALDDAERAGSAVGLEPSVATRLVKRGCRCHRRVRQHDRCKKFELLRGKALNMPGVHIKRASGEMSSNASSQVQSRKDSGRTPGAA